MNTSIHNKANIHDSLRTSELRITALDINQENNTLLVTLNTGKTILTKLDLTARLRMADSKSLNNYEIIAQGTGIHWPLIDEDLSLNSLLQNQIK